MRTDYDLRRFSKCSACISGVPVHGEQKTAAGEGEGLKNGEGDEGNSLLARNENVCRLADQLASILSQKSV